jgi:hypothetical protein
MSGPAEKKRADHAAQEAARLRLWAAEVASSLAATEEKVARTLGENCPASVTARRRAVAGTG